MRHKRLMRTWYKTDAEDGIGTFSAPFPWRTESQIVNVDWSVPGEVEVTWLIDGGKGGEA